MKVVLFATETRDHAGERGLSIGMVDESGERVFEASGTMASVGARLKTWIEQFDDQVMLYTDSLERDFSAYQVMLQEMDGRPRNLEDRVAELAFEPAQQARFDAAVAAAYAAGRHRDHVLDVARANQIGWAAAVTNLCNP